MAARIAIFAEAADWHVGRLAAALGRRGCAVHVLSLKTCGFAVGAAPHGLCLPGFVHELPDAAFVRILPNGTTEQITLRLGVLHALREAGVRVVNDARAIERCVDKSMTSFLITRAGLPTPRTLVLEAAEAAQGALDAAPGDMVLKPLFGAQGRGLKRLAPGARVPPPEEVAGVYYLQDFVPPAGAGHGDFRVFVIGGHAVAAMRREAEGWITNIHQGAQGVAIDPEGDLAALAVAAAEAVGADVAGVDLIRGADGALQILEVNSMPAWSGLHAATGRDMAEPIAALLAGTAA
ncbi:ATP-grasp domain-containing protein [Aquabacter spiritensis]|uniref:SSU ribosomal protein S6P modification protein n=1 Tax=Aquabacter spiritensis TaxID=933073 RepID=A0A4R3M0V1_9HYPH|nr:RimK family alpha-L-glutamate ligase [Aquabacter spiritensis]TCT04715.1 SSU ribosomal protein S6P modification protein [Aquabacter spiritensis]